MNKEQQTNNRRLLEAVIECAYTWGKILAEYEGVGDADRLSMVQKEAAAFLSCLPITLLELLKTDYADCHDNDLGEWVCEQTLNKINAFMSMCAMGQGK